MSPPWPATSSTAPRSKLAKISPPSLDRPEENSGLIVLAMGKMGAGELNYSSDIDLIVLFDPRARAQEAAL